MKEAERALNNIGIELSEAKPKQSKIQDNILVFEQQLEYVKNMKYKLQLS